MTGLSLPAVSIGVPSIKGGSAPILAVAAPSGVPSLASFVDMMASGTAMVAAGTGKVATTAEELQDGAASGKTLPRGKDDAGDPSLAWLFPAVPQAVAAPAEIAATPVNDGAAAGIAAPSAKPAAPAGRQSPAVIDAAAEVAIPAEPSPMPGEATPSPRKPAGTSGVVAESLTVGEPETAKPGNDRIPIDAADGMASGGTDIPASLVPTPARGGRDGAAAASAASAAPLPDMASLRPAPQDQTVLNGRDVSTPASAAPVDTSPQTPVEAAAPAQDRAAIVQRATGRTTTDLAGSPGVSGVRTTRPTVIGEASPPQPAVVRQGTQASAPVRTAGDASGADAVATPVAALPSTVAVPTAAVARAMPTPAETDGGATAGTLRAAVVSWIRAVPTPEPAVPNRAAPAAQPAATAQAAAVAPVSIPAQAAAMPALFALHPARANTDDRDAGVSVTGASAALLQPTDTLRAATRAGEAQHQALDMARHDWPQKMIDRIDALRDAANANDTSIRLVPDALGRVDVSIRHQGNGAVSVHFTAENAVTRTMIADAQPQLNAAAEARGIRLSGTSVDLSGSGAGQGGDQARQQFELRQNISNRLATREEDTSAVDDGRIA